MKLSTTRSFVFFGALGCTLASIACSASQNSSGGVLASTGGNSNSGSGASGNVFVTAGNGAGNGGTGSDVVQPDGSLLLTGTIRDFHSTYPDMEPCTNSPPKLCDSGHVEQNPTASDMTQNCGLGTHYPNSCFIGTTIGSDSKPVYVGPAGGTVTTTGPDNFHNWFNTADPSLDINLEADVQFSLQPNGDGTFSYVNNAPCNRKVQVRVLVGCTSALPFGKSSPDRRISSSVQDHWSIESASSACRSEDASV